MFETLMYIFLGICSLAFLALVLGRLHDIWWDYRFSQFMKKEEQRLKQKQRAYKKGSWVFTEEGDD